MLLPATLWHSKSGPAGLAGKQGEVRVRPMLLPATLWHSKSGPAGLAGKQGEVRKRGLAAVFNTPSHRVSGEQWWNLRGQLGCTLGSGAVAGCVMVHPRKWCRMGLLDVRRIGTCELVVRPRKGWGQVHPRKRCMVVVVVGDVAVVDGCCLLLLLLLVLLLLVLLLLLWKRPALLDLLARPCFPFSHSHLA